jgi:hypothetical protein
MVVALKLHSNYFYILVTKLHELYMYMISYTVNCICCNSYNLSNSTHIRRNSLSCNNLQIVIAIEKPSYKISCKSPHFFIANIHEFLH